MTAGLIAGHTGAVLVLVLAGSVAGCRPRVPPPDLASRIASAQTPEDHIAISRALAAKADEYAAAAAQHRRQADAYRTSGSFLAYRHHDRSELRFAEHCNGTAEGLERAVAELHVLAHEHEDIARKVRAAPPERTP